MLNNVNQDLNHIEGTRRTLKNGLVIEDIELGGVEEVSAADTITIHHVGEIVGGK